MGRGALGDRHRSRQRAPVDTELVRGYLDGKIARYKISKKVVIIDELPRTASGKVRKADLRSRYGG
jgi:fatty-acyl-CoA synthase